MTCRKTLFRPASTVGVSTQHCSDLSRLFFTFHRYCGYKLAITTTMHLHKLLASQLERGMEKKNQDLAPKPVTYALMWSPTM